MTIPAAGSTPPFRLIGLVSFAHLLSHLYMLALPPLFPSMREEIGVSYVELGFAITAYAITTGLLQTPMGFLVNRIGGGKVLIGGLMVNALAIGGLGLAQSFWQVIALMLLAGVGSSVFHPADYSILSTRVGSDRLGRALATHQLGGNLGFVVAPPLMVLLAALFGWRMAFVAAGGLGLLCAAVMAVWIADFGDARQAAGRTADSWGKLARSPTLLLLFLFYTLAAAANSGILHFSVSSLREMYGLPVAAAATALTAYQVMTMLAVLPGGWLADRTKNHDLVLAVCLALSAAFIITGGMGVLPFTAVIVLLGLSGAMHGLVNASRDVSVRHAATDVSVGTVFGFVTTGYSLGQIIGPGIYGLLLDAGKPHLVFVASAVFSLLAILTMLSRRGVRPQAAAASA
ncbi:MAG: transporter [Hyphomicrobiales bacterium]|nr:transporter [Hyphomicrobiales bacterium]